MLGGSTTSVVHALPSALRGGLLMKLPAQRLDDFVRDRMSDRLPETSCRTGRRAARVRDFVPGFVTDRVVEAMSVFDRQIPGYVGPEAIICGPEARSSAPVRIERDRSHVSVMREVGRPGSTAQKMIVSFIESGTPRDAIRSR